MKPTVLSYSELDEQFVKDELAQLNHAIDQDNESRAMVNKPALPHLKYGSKAQLTDEVIAQAEEDIKAELAAEGKPEKIWDKIIRGMTWTRSTGPKPATAGSRWSLPPRTAPSSGAPIDRKSVV